MLSVSRTTQVEVFLVETLHRRQAVKSLLEKLGIADFAEEHVALKANYNSADKFPASTHIETLQAIVEQLKEAKVADVTLGERSGMGNTRRVLEDRGALALSKKLGFGAVVLDELDKAN